MVTENLYKNVFTSLTRLTNIGNILHKVASSPRTHKYRLSFNTIKRYAARNENALYKRKVFYDTYKVPNSPMPNSPFHDAVFTYDCISSDLEDIRDDYSMDDRVSDFNTKHYHNSNTSSDLESLYRVYATRKIKKYQLMKEPGRSIWTL